MRNRARVAARRRAFRAVARRRVSRALACDRRAARAPIARVPWFRQLARGAAGALRLTEGGRLIALRSAESCDIPQCSALLRPPAEVVGTSLRSVLVGFRGARGKKMKSPRTRAESEPASLPRAPSAIGTQNTQPHCKRRISQRSVGSRSCARPYTRAQRRGVDRESATQVRGTGLADLVHQRRCCPCGRRMNEEMAA